MNRIYGELVKNLLLLWRDRAGLLILFLMPALLVVIITLVQNNVYRLMGESGAKVLLVDADGGELGREIVAGLKGAVLTRELAGRAVTAEAAKALVAAGRFQACIIIPVGASATLAELAGAEVRADLAGATHPPTAGPEVAIFFDPTVLGVFRGGLENGLTIIVRSLEIRARIKAFGEQLPGHLEREIRKVAGPLADYVSLPQVKIGFTTEPLLRIRGQALSRAGLAVLPTPVQHNVPAWALFGMFFIVVPMSVFFLRERKEGTLVRLLALPVPYPVILLGKVLAFVLVCFLQFVLIVLIGRFILPGLGLAAFDPGHHYWAVAVVVLAVALAATGYGLLLGCLARTYEQASMFGSISVVVASALGGVMVPVYAMPETMRGISAFSPVGWGLEAFLEIFVRGGDLSGLVGPLAALLAFGLGSGLLAWLAFIRRSGSV